jgi:solute:Na+ symporter, SSS family
MDSTTPVLEQRAVEELRELLRQQTGFVKVHAAESLLAFGYPQGVHEMFIQEWKDHQHVNIYRTAIMRVLSQSSTTPVERSEWSNRLRDIFVDPGQPDRLHAIEALAKLGYHVDTADRKVFEDAAKSDKPDLATFARWTLASTEYKLQEPFFVQSLRATDPTARYCAAYVLRQSPAISTAARNALTVAAQIETPGTLAFTYLNSASFAVSATTDVSEARRGRAELEKLANIGTRDEVREACAGFAAGGTAADLALMTHLLSNSDPDIRESAAHAIVRIGRRAEHRIGFADWAVIGGYAIGLLVIGWSCSRYIVTTEDFLLGGRHLNPAAVALSLFAGLISTLSYLAMPGEMIKHGPMIASEILAYPLIMLIVGYYFIPRFMTMKYTTAYELLETRLGVQARVLAATLFLIMRFFWMGLILYATTRFVLVPMFNWSESSIPYLCIMLGVITVIYSTMGGFRAVVITDSIQTFIMFAGALTTIGIISFRLGGVTSWWPTEWAATWDTPKFWFDPSLRVTMVSVGLAALTWHVCTAGSDQMAVQRYLAVRNVRSARLMFSMSLVVNCLATVLLAILGIAVFAYFRAHPDMLGDGQSITANADELFPRFIVVGFPTGASGLVIAALLSAAMGSLSSGISSTSSVILVDVIDRARGFIRAESNQVSLARYITWTVGAVIVCLSFLMNLVAGNLYEVTSKVVNLLVAPLFVLFFMAMFVPRASTWGSIVATLCSIVVGISIAFFNAFGLSFLWIMPSSLVTGILIGVVLSLPGWWRGVADTSTADRALINL